MRNLDFSSVHALLTTLLSLAVITLIGVGIRLVTQVTIQQRRERMNRQINERLRALMAAYKTLGGSFTGDLTVDPTHHRDLPRHADGSVAATGSAPLDLAPDKASDRSRRIRDAVEAALSDIILLGTEQQAVLAVHAAHELVTGNLVHTQELVVSLRAFIREALDLDPLPVTLAIPAQGPARPSASGGRDKGDKADKGSGSGGGGGGGMGGGGGGSMGMGPGPSSDSHHPNTDEEQDDADSTSNQ